MNLQYQEKCIRRKGSPFCRDFKIVGEKIIANWWRTEGHRVDAADVADILAASPEVFIVGTMQGFPSRPHF